MIMKSIKIYRKFLILSLVSILIVSVAAGAIPVDEKTVDLNIKAAYNDDNIHFLFEFNSADASYPGIYHDYYRYENGSWVVDGYNEDRMTMLLGGHQVENFDTLGCFLTCHDDVRFMPDAPSSEQVAASDYLGGVLGVSDVRKYIPESRDHPISWDNVVSQEELDQLRQEGTFLDLLHWRAHRSNPIGYSDSQNVLEYRKSDTGQSPYYTNWDAEGNHPAYMFDPQITGSSSLSWDDINDRKLTITDYYYIAEEFAISFDPEHDWQEGDTIPRRMLRVPSESRGQITADGTWNDGMWTVELIRKLDTGYTGEDISLAEGGMYYISPALHIGDTAGRDHYVTWGHSLGIGVGADVQAVRFEGQSPNWDDVPERTITMFYPSVMSYDLLLDNDLHGVGAACTEAGSPVPHGAERMGDFAFELENGPIQDIEDTEREAPGFGIVFAISGMLFVFFLVGKRK